MTMSQNVKAAQLPSRRAQKLPTREKPSPTIAMAFFDRYLKGTERRK